ncbi:MAG: 7-cyano-7-deazaguanine synthase QueC [Elusimicrobiota bacterium]|nr:7-cyano-7-deazaguanine synthase QueC [Endomicrobiia bacterium]MDW8166001.1 7-cyano-7-deazaguanine synthase QueC [Elusimicrobiota bacterium]
MKNKKCIVLLSGGLDSTTTLYYVLSKNYSPICLIFDYGQKHKKEIKFAKKIAKNLGLEYYIIKFNLPWKGSSLLDKNQDIPINRKLNSTKIPSTYVPARNVIFLSYAISLAEVMKVKYIFYGANQVDFSGYPDCRKEFILSFQKMANKATVLGNKGVKIEIKAPLLKYTKSEILKLAIKLKVPLELTWSCYRGKKRPCGVCDACRYRKKAFLTLGIKDPLEN